MPCEGELDRWERVKIRQSTYFDWTELRSTIHWTSVSADPSLLKIVVAAGGTGGHLFPAMAVVEQLQRLTGGQCRPHFLGSEDRMEATLIPQAGYPYTAMPIAGFRGVTHPSTLSLPLKIVRSVQIARRTIKLHRPSVVLVTGAYISYPAGRAAIKEGVPLVIMESNVNPGKTNAQLAGNASAIVASFEESREFFPASVQDRIHVVGNPVRQQIKTSIDGQGARLGFALDATRPTVLVFGGSLGARSINRAVQKLVDRWTATQTAPPWQLIWQTGADYTAVVSEKLRGFVCSRPFLDDMGSAYAAADLVVCRSGATTIAELGIVGKPAVLIPLPSASTNEQRHNARVVERRGAAIVVEDEELDQRLGDTIDAMMIDERRRSSMATSMRTLGKPLAAEEAARIVLRIGQQTQQRS